MLRANIEQMAARARSAGADLWPHVKTHKSTPGGYGAVLGEPAISVGRLYEEHAIARLPRDLDLPIGSRVRIVPNHACVAANMHRTMLMLDRGSVAAEWATGSAGWS